MNRVIIINLNGNAYQLEDSGYDALRAYLDNAERRLSGNPDKAEILADIEQAIADRFRAVLGPNKTVVVTREVLDALAAMGPVQDAEGSGAEEAGAGATPGGAKAAASASAEDATPAGGARRLYAIREGAMLVGVCNGLAAYFNVDVTIVRIGFVILTLLWGAGALLYLVMALIIPTADTPTQKAAAYGAAATAQEFIRRARAGYYEGMKTFHDKHARREWKRKFRQQMRGWKHSYGGAGFDHSHRWHSPWNPPVTPVYGASFGPPLFWLLNAFITVVGIYAIYSLANSGEVFGLGLPAGIPLWIGILGIIVLWNIVAWPIKVLHWGASAQLGCRHRLTGPFGAFGDFLVGIAFLVLVVWLADRYSPHFHEALKELPPLLHRGVDAVQGWLEKR